MLGRLFGTGGDSPPAAKPAAEVGCVSCDLARPRVANRANGTIVITYSRVILKSRFGIKFAVGVAAIAVAVTGGCRLRRR